jgi:hypothetical protein
MMNYHKTLDNFIRNHFKSFVFVLKKKKDVPLTSFLASSFLSARNQASSMFHMLIGTFFLLFLNHCLLLSLLHKQLLSCIM